MSNFDYLFDHDEFKKISQACIKRVKRELTIIVESDIAYHGSFGSTIETDEFGNKYLLISIYNNNDDKYYEFKFQNNYPFTPPKLNLNFKPYLYYLKAKSNEFTIILSKLKKIRCLCCDTITCPDNWSPAFTIIKIMDEVSRYHKICREIADFVIIKVIKRKYLIDDINILEWLYY